MGRVGIDNLEGLQSLRLDADDRAELAGVASECTFVYTAATGWASGVVMSFVHKDDRYWLTATADRPHARAILDDPRVTLVVSNAGTGLSGRRMFAVRGLAFVHRDEGTKRWFLPAFTEKLAPNDPKAFEHLLDTPKRVIIEVRPVSVAVSHDSRKLPGDGRGSFGGTTVPAVQEGVS